MQILNSTNPTATSIQGSTILLRCEDNKLIHNTVQGTDILFGENGGVCESVKPINTVIHESGYTVTKHNNQTFIEMFESEDISIDVNVTDTGEPVDIRYCIISGQLKDFTRKTVIADFNIDEVDLLNGMFSYGLTSAQTSELEVCHYEKAKFYFAIKIEYQNGSVDVVDSGYIIINQI